MSGLRLTRYLCLCIAALILAASAAHAADQRLAEGFTALPVGAKVVIMPLDVELFSLSAGGIPEPQAEWTNQAQENLKQAFQARLSTNHVSLTRFPGDQPGPDIDDLNRLHGAVGAAITIHHLGAIKLPTKEGHLEWSLGPDVALIKQQTGADYALFTFIRDSYATAERKVAIVVAAALDVGLGGGVQTGYASLVNLSTGDVVWFNRLFRGHGDLRELEPAKETLDALLQSFPG